MEKRSPSLSHVAVIAPTYNEAKNIRPLIQAIREQIPHISSLHRLSILIVDDSSIDGTTDIVRRLQKTTPNLHLLTGKKEGLGVAYQRGYTFALEKLKADIIVGMDADLSHHPKHLPKLVRGILEGNDVVIGSRYVRGGAIPRKWSLFRRLNSKIGNLTARHVAGLRTIQDTTGAYRAFKATFLSGLNVSYVGAKGFVFLVGLLHLALKSQARIKEIPIHFKERLHGRSKMELSDITEFITYCFNLRLKLSPLLSTFFILLILVGPLLIALWLSPLSSLLSILLVVASTLLVGMSLFILYLMLYAWKDAYDLPLSHATPTKWAPPRHSFSLLIPVRHEQGVIAETLKAVSQLNYPPELFEVILIARKDDIHTIAEINRSLKKLQFKNSSVVIFNGYPINKPHGLNHGLENAQNELVVIFDAEDHPHQDILNVANTTFLTQDIDVLQSGVQLMNVNSSWYSPHNILEYFFWFKSALHFFASSDIVPLGGNSVFFKKEWLEKIGGWDEESLTEDADIGIRLCASGAKCAVVYNEAHATREETPPTITSFIKQRTRWIQGFLQIFFKGDWMYLKNFPQRALALYILLSPVFQLLSALIIPLTFISLLFPQDNVLVSMYTFLPLELLFLQLLILNIGFYEFTKKYHLSYSLSSVLKLSLTYFPYIFLLGISALRAIFRLSLNRINWEKTEHTNSHRPAVSTP